MSDTLLRKRFVIQIKCTDCFWRRRTFLENTWVKNGRNLDDTRKGKGTGNSTGGGFGSDPTVWETNITGKSKLAEPVKIDLKEGAGTARIKQYLIKSEVRQELKKLIDKFLEYKILEECESEYNTPILPAKKTLGWI